MCTSALEAVGLDPYVGFMHTDRPGRRSLALDLVEEFRAWFCDRFVLMLINKKVVNADNFEKRENGAVMLNEKGRKEILQAWQKRKSEMIKHPFSFLFSYSPTNYFHKNGGYSSKSPLKYLAKSIA